MNEMAPLAAYLPFNRGCLKNGFEPAKRAAVTGVPEGRWLIMQDQSLIVGSDGRVKHVHILSAFPEQSQAILAAVQTWRFKPYRRGGKVVPFETGMMFGVDRRRDAAGPAAGTAALH